MDALSEILRVVQLNGAIFFNARFTAPWCVASPAEASLAKLLGVGAERVLLYHYMLEGACLITLEGMTPLLLGAGDTGRSGQAGDDKECGAHLHQVLSGNAGVSHVPVRKAGPVPRV